MTRATPHKSPYLRGLSSNQRKTHCHRLQIASPQTPQQRLLLDLPPELSDYIYGLTLINNDTIGISIERINTRALTKATKTGPLLGTKMRAEPPLLWTCRQIRKTAVPIYYGRNAFASFQGGALLQDWLANLGGTKQQMLKEVHIQQPSPHNYIRTDALFIRIWCLSRFERELAERGVMVSSNVLRDPNEGSTLSELEATLPADNLRRWIEMKKMERPPRMRRKARRNPRRKCASTGAS